MATSYTRWNLVIDTDPTRTRSPPNSSKAPTIVTARVTWSRIAGGHLKNVAQVDHRHVRKPRGQVPLQARPAGGIGCRARGR